MELQTALICGGVVVATAAVLLLVSLFGSSGASYEEAMAEQRRAASELLALANPKNKQQTKKSKKAGKKAKEKKSKESVQTGSERDSDAPADSGLDEEPPAHTAATKGHVEFGEDTILDEHVTKPIKSNIRKRGKDKIKPILINKEDPSIVTDMSVPPSPTDSTVSNHFEEIHPKDEFELMHSSTHAPDKVSEKKEDVVEKKESKPAKSGKGSKNKQGSVPGPAVAATAPAPPTHSPPPAPEPVREEPAHKERHNSGDSAKEQRKTKRNDKKHQVDETGDKTPKEESAPVAPLNMVSPADLTTDKILKQTRTEVQAQPAQSTPTAGKGKKNKKSEQNVMALMGGDVGGINVGELVRLVSEASLSRTEIQILTDALLNKQHGPLPEHSEWTEGPNDPVQKLKKQLAEKEKALADEQEASQALHAKLKELRASLNSERSRANASASAARAAEEQLSGNKAEVHTLQARLQRLLDDNHALSQEMHLLQSKLNAEGEQRVQAEMHIQRLSDEQAAYLSQLNALQAELGARVLEVGQARCEAVAARDGTLLAQQHAADLAQQLQEANRVCGELEAQRQNALHSEQVAQNELRAAKERLASMAELQAEVQRLSGRAQAALQGEKSLEEADRLNQQLSNEIKSLREQLVAKDEELKKQQHNHQQNGLPRQEDSQKKLELLNLENALESLRGELAAAQSSHAEERKQLATLQQQLQQYRDKNNELRTKNWKVMEALQTTEKQLHSKAPAPSASVNEAILKACEQQYRDTADLLRTACPQAAEKLEVDDTAGKEWLKAFADQLTIVLRAAGPARATTLVVKDEALEKTVNELQSQNKYLQELVDKYKTIIDDTEGVLSRLQHNVSLEEQRWARQLDEKQRELDHLQQQTVTQMQSKIDTLQAELNRERAGGGGKHYHNALADMERSLEENSRLSSITDKHQLEFFNGPSQVGLEEK